MGPKPQEPRIERGLFRMERVRLAGLIDWSAFEQQWGPNFESTTGRRAMPTRLMASLT